MIRSLLLSTAAGLGLAASGGAPARAACVADTTGFVCNGLDLDGVRDERAGILGRFQTGSRVVRDEYVPGGSTPPAVVVGDRATLLVDEDARIEDRTGAGVVAAGNGLTLLNDGAVGGRFFDFNSPRRALVAGDDLRVVNGATGSISAEAVAIRGGDRASIVNEGGISSLIYTVTLGDDALFVNALGAELFGQEDLITAGTNLRVRNAGVMEGYNEGILAGAGLDLENTGTIRSGTGVTGGAGSRTDNRGVIASGFYGVLLGAESQVFNDGESARIYGEEWAIRGGESLKVYNTGQIESFMAAVIGDDRTAVDNGETGQILADKTAIQVDGQVYVDNQGLIRGGDTAIGAAFVSLIQTRSGRVEAVGDAVHAQSVGGDNYGTVRSERGDAIDAERAYVEIYGAITAPEGAAFRLRGTRAGAYDFANSLVGERGTIEGRVAIEVARGRADTRVSQASGTIRGTSGTAIRLANGDDQVTLFDTLVEGDVILGGGDDELFTSLDTRLEGRTLFGAGRDRLILRRSMFEEVTAGFGLFDGGAGLDTVRFEGFSLASLSLRAMGGGFFFDLTEGASRLTGSFARFERFRFDDGTLALDGGVPAPVPLPAALPLLAAGLLGLGWIGRQRAG